MPGIEPPAADRRKRYDTETGLALAWSDSNYGILRTEIRF